MILVRINSKCFYCRCALCQLTPVIQLKKLKVSGSFQVVVRFSIHGKVPILEVQDCRAGGASCIFAGQGM